MPRREGPSPTRRSTLHFVLPRRLPLIRLPGLLRSRYVRRLGGRAVPERQHNEVCPPSLANEIRSPGPNVTRASQTPGPTLLWAPRLRSRREALLPESGLVE